MKCRLIFGCLQVTTIKTVKQMEDLVNLGDGAAWHEKWRIKLTTLFHQVINCEMCCCLWSFTPDITHLFHYRTCNINPGHHWSICGVFDAPVWVGLLITFLFCYVISGKVTNMQTFHSGVSGAVFKFCSSSLYIELKFSPQDMLKVQRVSACWRRFQGWGIFTKPSLERKKAGGRRVDREAGDSGCLFWPLEDSGSGMESGTLVKKASSSV